jgi:serine-type D-Ala-D-Ala endopeptidase (penicillin-binding protein 7)
LNRLVHTIALSVLALVLAPAGAQATTSSKQVAKERTSVVKRARISRTYTASRSQGLMRAHSVVRIVPAKPSFGQLAGLHATQDELDLKSSVALVIDQDKNEVLLSKNDSAVLPIASITKLMTGLIISEAKLPMDEEITITQDDVDTEKGSSSRLRVGTTLPRGELLHLALMSSENRAAHALGRTYPGGLSAFVDAMNQRAQLLGMKDTQYIEPTGLSPRNHSTAQDLARLITVASQDKLLSELTTSPSHAVEVGHRTMEFHTTNRLVKNPAWDIMLQKTGYITEAGQCLVMSAKVAGRKLIMVFLDSAGKLSRIGDAERVRKWVETRDPTGVPMPAAGTTSTLVRQVSG